MHDDLEPAKSKPTRKLVVEFTKMSGAGNDFLVIDNRFYHFSGTELSQMARLYCRRRLGVGADGLLALAESEGDLDFRMRYLNADGTVGTMCGNGARCLAQYASDAGLSGNPLRFMTDAGSYSAEVKDASVRLFIPPYRDVAEIREDSDGPERHYIWTGTEHLVVFCDHLDAVDVVGMGERLRRTNPPNGVNVNFVEVSGQTLRVRTFEKGVEAETLACGTGATAAAAIARFTGRLSRADVSVSMRGGELVVGFDSDGAAIYLEGPAETVFRGTLEL